MTTRTMQRDVKQIAEQLYDLRLQRAARALCERRGLRFAPVWETLQRARAEAAALHARGLTTDDILALKAKEMGMTVEQLRAKCRTIEAALADL